MAKKKAAKKAAVVGGTFSGFIFAPGPGESDFVDPTVYLGGKVVLEGACEECGAKVPDVVGMKAEMTACSEFSDVLGLTKAKRGFYGFTVTVNSTPE